MSDEQPMSGNAVESVEVPVDFGLGRLTIPLREFRAIQRGHVFQLDGSATDPVRIEVNGAVIGRGALVLVDGRLGVQLTETTSDGNEPA